MFKKSVRTSKRTQHFAITKIIWVMLCQEIIPGCTENDSKAMNAKCRVADC